MWWIIGAISVAVVLTLWASLKVASDEDDRMGLD